MNSRVFAQFAFLLALILGGSQSPSLGFGQELLLTEMPERVRAHGRVCDEAGVGIPAAEVRLIVSGRPVWAHFVLEDPPSRSATTDADGYFSLDFEVDDPLLLNFSTAGTVQFLWVQREGYGTQVFDVSLLRLMVDFPFEFVLKKSVGLELLVLDDAGNPVPQAEVAPAKMAGKQLYRRIAGVPGRLTDEQGRVVLAGMEPFVLEAVFVRTATHGNQMVTVAMQHQQPVARLRKTGRVAGRLRLPEDAPPRDWSGTFVSVLTVTEGQMASLEYAWDSVELDAAGCFVASSMPPGEVWVRFPDTADLDYWVPYQSFPRLQPDPAGDLSVDVVVNVSPLQSQEIQWVDEAGQPLAGIMVRDAQGVYGERPQVSGADGIYRLRWPSDESLDGQLFPGDAFERFQVTDPFGVSLARLQPAAGQPIQVRLSRSQSLRGVVTDGAGNRVAGATVTYVYGSERFQIEAQTVADHSGDFEIRGLPAGVAVTVRARSGHLATDATQVLSVTAGTPRLLSLVLVPQAMASPTGRVVDAEGRPVAGARVVLKQGVVFEAEGFSGESLQASDIRPDFPAVLSDEAGRFHFPQIAEFGERLLVQIQAPGFLNRVTPFYDGSVRLTPEQQVELGDIRLIAEPSMLVCQVEVLDESSGQPVSGAEVVFVGILSGRTAGMTDAAGKLEISLKNSPQVMAVRGPTQPIHFQFLDQVAGQLTIRLPDRLVEAEGPRHPWFERDPAEYLSASRRLLDALPVPSPEDSTFYRQYQYFAALAGTDPTRMQQLLGEQTPAYEYRDDLMRFNLPGFVQQAPQSALVWCRQTAVPVQTRLQVLSQVARLTTNADERDELLGEAAIAASQLSGSDRLVQAGLLAQQLLLSDRREAAEAILQETWAAAADLQQILAKGEEQIRIAESRFFAPMYAVVDLPAALKLIQLTAVQAEKPDLVSEALWMHSLATGRPLAELLRQQSHSLTTNDQSFLIGSLGHVPELSQWLSANLEAMPTCGAKIQLTFLLMRHLPPGPERQALMRTAAGLRAGSQVTYYYDDPVRQALREIGQFRSLEVGELDEFIFACLQHTPEQFSDRTVDVFGNLARLLAWHDTDLARRCLQSAIDVDVWQRGVSHRSRFTANQLLRSAAWIDPTFACEVAEALAADWKRDGATVQLELYSDMVQALNEVRWLLQGPDQP